MLDTSEAKESVAVSEVAPSEVSEEKEGAFQEVTASEEKDLEEKSSKKVAAQVKEEVIEKTPSKDKPVAKRAKDVPQEEVEELSVKGIKTNFSDKLGTSSLARTMYGALCKNSRRLNRRLKTHITGRIQLIVSGGKENYVLDWRGEDLLLNDGRDPEAECVIEISERDLLDVIKGNSNLQIALLSDKVKLSGQVGMALYLSNIFG